MEASSRSRCAEQVDAGEGREDGLLCGEFAEEHEGFEAGGVERVVDVFGEVGADGAGGDAEARRPFLDESVDVCEAVIAAVIEIGDELGGGERAGFEGPGADSPDGGHPGKAGVIVPEAGDVEPEERMGRSVVDGGAVLAGEQGGVADEQGSVVGSEHGEWVGGMLGERGVDVGEAGKQEADVGGGTAGSAIGGDGANQGKGFGRGMASGVLDQQQDAADGASGGDGATRNNEKIVSEGSDGDEAEVGFAGLKFSGTVCG